MGIVKPQVSFFERFGSQGIAALEDVLAAARAAGLVVIADAKRGDIGSTMDDYARAWLTPGSPLEADALTVNPFLGVGALDGHLRWRRPRQGAVRARRDQQPRGRTPAALHRLDGCDGVRRCHQRGLRSQRRGVSGRGVGELRFRDRRDRRLDPGRHRTLLPSSSILAPGFGAQGATPADLRRRFGPMSEAVIASESRSILSAGPADLAVAITARAAEYLEVAGV